LGDPVFDVLSMGVQRRRSSRSARPFWKRPGRDELAHGSVVDRELTSDTLHRAALGVQGHHFLVPYLDLAWQAVRALVIEMYAKRIVDWGVGSSMTTDFVLQAWSRPCTTAVKVSEQRVPDTLG
jgi:hypothetical protein